MAQKRRDFIKISSLNAAGLIFGGHQLRSAIPPYSNNELVDFGPMSTQRTPTYCEVCFWQCAGWVYKDEDGQIQKITGNDDDANCNGRLCPRGTGGVGMYYDEDRLKTPLIRVKGKDGKVSPQWKLTVPEAISAIPGPAGGFSSVLFGVGFSDSGCWILDAGILEA